MSGPVVAPAAMTPVVSPDSAASAGAQNDWPVRTGDEQAGHGKYSTTADSSVEGAESVRPRTAEVSAADGRVNPPISPKQPPIVPT